MRPELTTREPQHSRDDDCSPPIEIRRVLIVGAGTMGRQIAAHCQIHGFEVVLHDTNPHALDDAAQEIAKQGQYFARWKHFIRRAVDATKQLRIETDAERAAKDCDLLIESVPERLRLKQQVYEQFDRICPPRTIFATNTSSMLPSRLAELTSRPSRFAALHFFPFSFVAEIMGHAGTDPRVLDQLEAFALAIKHIPIRCLKERQGYVFNYIYMAFVSTAMELAADGVASVEDIDRCWMEATGMPDGPFSTLDFVGLDTALDVTSFLAHLHGDEQSRKNAEFLRQYVDRGKLGAKSNHGFYDYPQPRYRHSDFLKPVRLADLSFDERDDWPILESVIFDDAGGLEATLVIDPKTCAFVRDHCFKQTPLFPMSATIEILRFVMRRSYPQASLFEIQDFEIANALRFFTDRPAVLSLQMRPCDDAWQVTLSHDYYNRAGKLVQANRPLVRARVVHGTRTLPMEQSTTGQIFEVEYGDNNAMLSLGATMQCLQSITVAEHHGCGLIQCNPPVDASYTRHDLAIAALDAALVACHAYTQQKVDGAVQLASRADLVRIGRPPEPREACRVYFAVREFDDTQSVFDVSLQGADGAPLFELEGYRCTILRSDEPPPLKLCEAAASLK